MRIVIKEIRKVLNLKLIIILMLFSAVYVTQIPYISMSMDGWWNHSSSPYDVDFYRQLIDKFGPTLTLDEWDDFVGVQQNLIDEFMDNILQNEIMQKNNIDTYDKFIEARNEARNWADIGENEQSDILQEFNRLTFEDPITSPILFKIQCSNSLVSDKEYGYVFSDKNSAEKKMSEWIEANHYGYLQKMSEKGKKRIVQVWMSSEMTLLHEAVIKNVEDDFVRMTALAVIWIFVLILSYQITERLKNVRQIQLSTKTGRKIFGRQAAVCSALGAAVGIAVSAVYAFLLWRKGGFDFIRCPINTIMTYYWIDMSYGDFLILCAGVLIMISVAAAFLAYLISRLSANYIAGLGISIPVCVILCVIVNKIMLMPLDMHISELASYFLICVPLVLLPLAGAVMTGVMLRRDKVRDIL